MTIEELTAAVITSLPRLGAENPKTVQGARGESLTVTYNAKSPITLDFPTPGWRRSGTNPDPTGERHWKVDFLKNDPDRDASFGRPA
jgi:hypothetical protein